MDIDRTTLADLEVLEDSQRRGGVLGLLDYTSVPAGYRALKRRLREPLAEAAEIRATQSAVRFFAAVADVRGLVRPETTLLVSRYLESNVASLEYGPLRRVRLAVLHRDVVQEVRSGVSVTEAWLRELQSTMRWLNAQNPPDLVLRLVERCLSEIDGLPSTSGSTSLARVLEVDRALRGDERARLRAAMDVLGELDALRSMARATRMLGWSFPDIIESDEFVLEGEGLFHPFLSDPTSNPVRLGGGTRVLFVTGPNMAGKTTYLRTTALVLLLAQMGMSVPARTLAFTPVEVLRTSLNPRDNLREGLSYFQAELLRVREVAVHVARGRRVFAVFDEVFRGTNLKDACDASGVVIRGLTRARRCGFMFASHLVELVEALRVDGLVRFECFAGGIHDEGAQFSYRVREGVSDQRLGLALLEATDIPELLAEIDG